MGYELNGVLGLVLNQLVQGLQKEGHQLGLKVRADGQLAYL
jgi:hypothetical protein